MAVMPFSHGIDVKKIFKINGTTVTSTAAEINTLASVTAGAVTASKALVVDASRDLATIGNVTSNGVIATTKTVTGTALGTVRAVYGQATASGTDIASGNLVGARGSLTLSGTVTAGGAALYGTQGKLLVTGTMNHADSRLCAMLAQLDISAGTYTSGQMSALWVDAGASASASAVSTKGGGQFNLIRITNTTTANANAVIYAYAEADYLMELGGPGGNADWFAANTHTIDSHALAYVLKIKDPAGAAGYIPVFAAVPA